MNTHRHILTTEITERAEREGTTKGAKKRKKGRPGGAHYRVTAAGLRRDVRVCSSAGTAARVFERSDVEEAKRVRLEERFLYEVGLACQRWLERRGLAVPSWFDRRRDGAEVGL